MDIFPFMDPTEIEIDNNISIAEEWAWDIENNSFLKENGKMYKVYRNEAIRIWIYKLFNVERFKNIIYSWDYGNELNELIGKGFNNNYILAEAKRYIEEAIEYNLGKYVTGIRNIEVDLVEDVLTIAFTVKTIYGEVDIVV